MTYLTSRTTSHTLFLIPPTKTTSISPNQMRKLYQSLIYRKMRATKGSFNPFIHTFYL